MSIFKGHCSLLTYNSCPRTDTPCDQVTHFPSGAYSKVTYSETSMHKL